MGNVKSTTPRHSSTMTRVMEPTHDRRTAILKAAAHLFIQSGFRASSLEDVAEQFGFKRQAIYYYFSSKEEVLYQILSFTMDVHEATMSRALASTSDPRDQLEALVRSWVLDITTREDDGEFSLLLDGEMHELTPEHREEIIRRQRDFHVLYRDLLAELKRRGQLRDLNPSVAALSMGAMVRAVAGWFRRDGPMSGEQIADEVTKVVAGLLLKNVDDSETGESPRRTEAPPAP